MSATEFVLLGTPLIAAAVLALATAVAGLWGSKVYWERRKRRRTGSTHRHG